MTIRSMTEGDAGAVLAIYGEGVATGVATLETATPTWEQWDADHLSSPRLVAEEGGEITGWVAVSRVSSRCVYEGVGELSIYVAEAARGKGWGGRLLQAALEASERDGLWTLEAWVLADNRASIRLLRRAGFRKVGVRERIGRLGGSWVDVLVYERRSGEIGRD